MKTVSKRDIREDRNNPYSGVERQLLNTFFSGIYISAKEFLDIGRDMKIDNLALKSRELLIKEIISRADKNEQTLELANRLVVIISERVKSYQILTDNYPKSIGIISQLVQKANASKRLIQGMVRANPYG